MRMSALTYRNFMKKINCFMFTFLKWNNCAVVALRLNRKYHHYRFREQTTFNFKNTYQKKNDDMETN